MFGVDMGLYVGLILWNLLNSVCEIHVLWSSSGPCELHGPQSMMQWWLRVILRKVEEFWGLGFQGAVNPKPLLRALGFRIWEHSAVGRRISDKSAARTTIHKAGKGCSINVRPFEGPHKAKSVCDVCGSQHFCMNVHVCIRAYIHTYLNRCIPTYICM